MNDHVLPEVAELAARLQVDLVGPARLDGFLRIAEGLRRRGFVILLKWDGERDTDAGDNGPYTVMVSNPKNGFFLRRDDETIEDAFEYIYSRLEAHEQ